MGDVPFRLKFALKVTHPFEKRQIRQISAYNVSTIRDSEKSSVMTNKKLTSGFLTSYSLDSVRMLPLSPRRVAEKRFFKK